MSVEQIYAEFFIGSIPGPKLLGHVKVSPRKLPQSSNKLAQERTLLLNEVKRLMRS